MSDTSSGDLWIFINKAENEFLRSKLHLFINKSIDCLDENMFFNCNHYFLNKKHL